MNRLTSSVQVYPAVAKFSKENNDTAVAATARELLKIQEVLEEDIILMNRARMERLEGYEKVRLYHLIMNDKTLLL